MMKHWKNRTAEMVMAEIVVPTDQLKDEGCGQPVYQAPQMFSLGRAVDLMKQSIRGQLKDGTGGWYVWGS